VRRLHRFHAFQNILTSRLTIVQRERISFQQASQGLIIAPKFGKGLVLTVQCLLEQVTASFHGFFEALRGRLGMNFDGMREISPLIQCVWRSVTETDGPLQVSPGWVVGGDSVLIFL